MSNFTIERTQTYESSAENVYQAALKAIEGLEGKLQEQTANEQIVVKFHKTILGKVLGDRTHFTADISANSPEETSIKVTIYPLDAIGRKLLFGARKGVSQTVAKWFFAHLEHHLKNSGIVTN